MSDNLTSRDLRIGNLIFNEYGIVSTIVEITDYDRVAVGNNRVVTDLVNCEPIPLTEEWLLKFGFKLKSDADGEYYENCGVNILILRSDDIHFFFGNPNTKDKYVHQLQNLYFALTQKELL
ncbi:hypothetical protein HZQ28_01105 [Elizabethkingia anophelis]|nr:hypothetical protein [Elizabethkingia anophelis]MCT3993085.1 hypothetical protein [Elizabethkingia anophelis]MCT3997142.1 hypothetical protein [Elizabethkingia anophelis]MCT4181811.1 hypothetical protein [Elizabethkingia anophelis]MCT4256604.1 hypothetical protein [Elizabethkingia anophelis]